MFSRRVAKEKVFLEAFGSEVCGPPPLLSRPGVDVTTLGKVLLIWPCSAGGVGGHDLASHCKSAGCRRAIAMAIAAQVGRDCIGQ